jgi:hypothetical protein
MHIEPPKRKFEFDAKQYYRGLPTNTYLRLTPTESSSAAASAKCRLEGYCMIACDLAEKATGGLTRSLVLVTMVGRPEIDRNR